MGNLYGFSIPPPSRIILFSCFSVIESLVSEHLVFLSGSPSHSIFHLGALLCVDLCVLIDQDRVNVLRLDILLINDRTLSGHYANLKKQGGNHFLQSFCRIERPDTRYGLISMTSSFSTRH